MIPWPTWSFLQLVSYVSSSSSVHFDLKQWEHPLGALRVIPPIFVSGDVFASKSAKWSHQKIVFLRFSAANRKTLILLEDRFLCCSNFSATYSGNHAMFCDNSTSHLNKIKMSPEILNKCSIEFCRPSSLSSVCSQNTAGPNIDFMIKIYMIRMCIYIYIHIRNHCSLLYETFSLKQLIEKMQIILDFCA
jgi:hypothetical protein